MKEKNGNTHTQRERRRVINVYCKRCERTNRKVRQLRERERQVEKKKKDKDRKEKKTIISGANSPTSNLFQDQIPKKCITHPLKLGQVCCQFLPAGGSMGPGYARNFFSAKNLKIANNPENQQS